MAELNIFCTITAGNGARIPLTLSVDATPTQLRQDVSETTKIPLAQLRLIFRGRMIKDDDSAKVVVEYKLETDCVLHCMGKPVESSSSSGGNASGSTTPMTTVAASTTASVPSIAFAAAPTPLTATTASPPQDPLQAALQTLRSSNSPSIYMTAVSTLEKILNNIAEHPMEEKYRTVKLQNAAFQKRLGGLQGGDAVMQAVGFVVEGQPPVYQMQASPDAWPKLMAGTAVVAAAVQDAKRASAAPTMPVNNNPFGMMPNNNNNMGGMPSMPAAAAGMPGGMDPTMMRSAMANMMSNPEALGSMLQVRVDSFFLFRKSARAVHYLYGTAGLSLG
jgi:hypothetical protein